MRIELHPCYILHRRNYRETSLLLEVFSSQYGRLSLLAKGAKQKKNNQAALLQPYQKIALSWSGRGALPTLIQVEMIDKPYRLSGQHLMTGFYLNELVMRLLHPNEPVNDLFDVYTETIQGLEQDKEEILLRCFEKKLLESIGYGLVLDHDVENGEPISSELSYFYCLGGGPTQNKPQYGQYHPVSGEALVALQHERFVKEETLQESKQLMRFILTDLLESKPLKSRELYQSYINDRQ